MCVCLQGVPLPTALCTCPINASLEVLGPGLAEGRNKEETQSWPHCCSHVPLLWGITRNFVPHVFALSPLTSILWLLFPFVPATAGNGKFVFWANVFLCPGISKHLFFYGPKIPAKMLSERSSSRGCPPPSKAVPLNEAPGVHFLKFISLCYQ